MFFRDELSQAMIVNGAVWGAVLTTDLGPARKVGVMRIVRPLVVAAVIVPLFAAKPATHTARAWYSRLPASSPAPYAGWPRSR